MEAEADRLDAAAYAAAHAGGKRDFTISARSTEAGRLRFQATQLRKELGEAAPGAAAIPVAPQIRLGETRESKIRAIAAGAAFQIPGEMVDRAIASGMQPEAFALEAASFCARVQKEFDVRMADARHEAEVDALAKRIAAA
jgi:hypothetical protein